MTTTSSRKTKREPWALTERHRAKLTQLLNIMAKSHTGRRNGARASHLASLVDLDDRELRKLVSAAREEGTAIVGTPGSGYYIAATAEELEECCRFLRGRAMHSLRMESQLRRIPLPDLVGQLHLPT